ncbi:MAG TPA: hypothetical protein VGK73_00470 [Polyangiaceae bacterium]
MPNEQPLTLTPSRSGLPAGWTPERFQNELERAAASFSQPAIPCTSLRLTVAAPEARRIAAEDGTSLVAFRSDAWCHNSRCGHMDTFPARVMAMTETHPDGARGAAIREADIELNAVHFRFTDAVTNVDRDAQAVPLRAVLLHELGHVLGLEDRCVPEGRHGFHAAVPELELCGPHEAESVMFAPSLNLELSPLDIAALCAAHPDSSAPSLAASEGVPGPSSSDWNPLGDSGVPIAVVLLLAVALVHAARRGRAQSQTTSANAPSVTTPSPVKRKARLA